MEPTDFYNRSKRNLAAFTSFFALILFGGVAPEEGTKILGFILAKDTLPAVLFVVVLYLLYQFILAISFQPDSIRKQQLITIDCYFLTTCAALSLLYYLLWHLPRTGVVAEIELMKWVGGFVFAALLATTLIRSSEVPKLRSVISSLRQQSIPERIKEPGWILNYNPAKPNATKPISFEKNGRIGEGGNGNEYSWVLDQGLLVIRRKNGELQNKFKYDSETDQFKSIPDEEAKGIKGQFIYRDS